MAEETRNKRPMPKKAVAFFVVLVVGCLVGGWWLYTNYQKKLNKSPADESLIDYLTALSTGSDLRMVYELATPLGSTLIRTMGHGSSVGGETAEEMLNMATKAFEKQWEIPLDDPDAVMPLERVMLPSDAEIDLTEVGEFAAEFNKRIMGMEAVEVISRKEVFGEEELLYVHVAYPNPNIAPLCKKIPNCPSKWFKRKLKSTVLEIQATSASLDPDYYDYRSWFDKNEEKLGNLPGWEAARTYFLSSESWTFQMSQYIDLKKTEFYGKKKKRSSKKTKKRKKR